MIDYRATGTLVASALLCADIHVIIAWTKDSPFPYVVSKYESGRHEWRSGTYFNTYAEALTKFTNMIICERERLGANSCSHL